MSEELATIERAPDDRFLLLSNGRSIDGRIGRLFLWPLT
jgi:hypothetical protein